MPAPIEDFNIQLTINYAASYDAIRHHVRQHLERSNLSALRSNPTEVINAACEAGYGLVQQSLQGQTDHIIMLNMAGVMKAVEEWAEAKAPQEMPPGYQNRKGVTIVSPVLNLVRSHAVQTALDYIESRLRQGHGIPRTLDEALTQAKAHRASRPSQQQGKAGGLSIVEPPISEGDTMASRPVSDDALDAKLDAIMDRAQRNDLMYRAQWVSGAQQAIEQIESDVGRAHQEVMAGMTTVMNTAMLTQALQAAEDANTAPGLTSDQTRPTGKNK